MVDILDRAVAVGAVLLMVMVMDLAVAALVCMVKEHRAQPVDPIGLAIRLY